MLYKDPSDGWWTVGCRRVREEAGRLVEDHFCCPKLRRWCFGLGQSWCRWREVRLICSMFIRESRQVAERFGGRAEGKRGIENDS